MDLLGGALPRLLVSSGAAFTGPAGLAGHISGGRSAGALCRPLPDPGRTWVRDHAGGRPPPAKVVPATGDRAGARSTREFGPRWTAARVLFDLDGEGRPTGFVFEIGGDRRPVKRVE